MMFGTGVFIVLGVGIVAWGALKLVVLIHDIRKGKV